MTKTLRRLALLLALAALPSSVVAHQLDEYLQAIIVALDPDDIRLKINLTPGADVAEQIISLIDRDHDGVISPGEADAYAELFKRNLIVRLDQRDLELKLVLSNSPAPADLRTGWGIIQLEFSLAPQSLAQGAHRLLVKNGHLPDISAYLVNAAKSDSVQITGQYRNRNQSSSEINFILLRPMSSGPPSSSRTAIIAASLAALALLVAGAWRARRVVQR